MATIVPHKLVNMAKGCTQVHHHCISIEEDVKCINATLGDIEDVSDDLGVNCS